MRRRDFFSKLVPVSRDNAPGDVSEVRTGSGPTLNDLFLLAMSRGIDPATVDPAQLPDLVRTEDSGTT